MDNIEFNNRIDAAITKLKEYIRVEDLYTPLTLSGMLYLLEAMKTPVETSGYSTKTPNLEPTIWLQRAKENIVKCNYDKATKCINEAIELIYGKAE